MTTSIKPYTYIAIHKTSGYFYYGVRLSNKVEAANDLGVVYFTSSATIRSIIEAEGVDSFIWIIRKEFADKKTAAYWEYKVIRRMLSHPKILNKAVSPVNVPGNWFTNGVINILGKYCPEGYKPGRTHVDTPARKQGYENQKSRVWWNNGQTSVHSTIAPSGEWTRGRLPSDTANWNGKSLSGKQWWNNGEENYRGNTPPPGFVLGRLKGFKHRVTRVRSPECNLQHSSKMKQKKWWTNGVTSVFTEQCPGTDYVRGRKKNS